MGVITPIITPIITPHKYTHTYTRRFTHTCSAMMSSLYFQTNQHWTHNYVREQTLVFVVAILSLHEQVAKQVLRLDRVEVPRLTSTSVRLKQAMEPRKPPAGWVSSAVRGSNSSSSSSSGLLPLPPPPPLEQRAASPPAKALPANWHRAVMGPAPPATPPPAHLLQQQEVDLEELLLEAPWRKKDSRQSN